MYKNFLTHQLALGFDREVAALEVPEAVREEKDKTELLRLSRQMVHYLNRSLYEKDEKEISKLLYVTVTYLRDCRELLAKLQVDTMALLGRYEVLHARLEQMCQEAAKSEGGQLRMLG